MIAVTIGDLMSLSPEISDVGIVRPSINESLAAWRADGFVRRRPPSPFVRSHRMEAKWKKDWRQISDFKLWRQKTKNRMVSNCYLGINTINHSEEIICSSDVSRCQKVRIASTRF